MTENDNNAIELMAKTWARESDQSTDWIGKPIASALGIDIGTGLTKDLTRDQKAAKAKVKAMLQIWIAAGAFSSFPAKDRKGALRSYVEVGDASVS